LILSARERGIIHVYYTWREQDLIHIIKRERRIYTHSTVFDSMWNEREGEREKGRKEREQGSYHTHTKKNTRAYRNAHTHRKTRTRIQTF
jgi:hypothetical protein